VTAPGPGAILLAYVTAQRLAELWWARHNEKRLAAAGGVKYGGRHFPLMVLLHAAWLGGLWAFGFGRAMVPAFVLLFVALQAARLWVLATLGRRWTVRIVVVPGERLVTRGPYRWLRHPNYAVVAGEIAIVPLALGLPVFALVFSILNAAVLATRVHAENAALGTVDRPNR
jgi:methyltransferase